MTPGMSGGPMPKPSDQAKLVFESMVPDGPTVKLRPMFGNLAAFVNGNMFAGLFGERLFVRLPEADRDELLRLGATDFEPMPGRVMRGYLTLPDSWLADPAQATDRVAQALEFSSRLPAKVPKPPKARR